jgi:hypothetical protein
MSRRMAAIKGPIVPPIIVAEYSVVAIQYGNPVIADN